VRINKGTARTVEEVCAIQFVSFLHTSVEKQTFRELFLSALSGQRSNAHCSLVFVFSLVFVLKLVVAKIFRKNGRLKFETLKSGALLSQGPQHCFIDDSHPSLCTVFLPTSVEIFICTRPHRVCHQHHEFYHLHRTVGPDMVKRSDLGY